MRDGIPARTIEEMPSSKIRVLMELDHATEPITGTLQQPASGDPKPFTGWLQLTQLLESIRSATIGERPDLETQ